MNLRYVCNSCFMIHSLKPSNPSRNLISGPSQLPRKHSFGPRPNGYWMRAKVVARDLCLGAEQDFFVNKKGRKQPCINGWFTWIPNLSMGNGCLTKHPLETGISLFSSKVSQLQNDHPKNAIGAGSFQSVVLLKYSHS